MFVEGMTAIVSDMPAKSITGLRYLSGVVRSSQRHRDPRHVRLLQCIGGHNLLAVEFPISQLEAQPLAQIAHTGLDGTRGTDLLVIIVPGNDPDFAVVVASVRAGMVRRFLRFAAGEDDFFHPKRLEETLLNECMPGLLGNGADGKAGSEISEIVVFVPGTKRAASFEKGHTADAFFDAPRSAIPQQIVRRQADAMTKQIAQAHVAVGQWIVQAEPRQ